MTTTVDVTPKRLSLIGYANVFNSGDQGVSDRSSGVIGANVIPRMGGGDLSFEVPVTVTGICFSPAP